MITFHGQDIRELSKEDLLRFAEVQDLEIQYLRPLVDQKMAMRIAHLVRGTLTQFYRDGGEN